MSEIVFSMISCTAKFPEQNKSITYPAHIPFCEPFSPIFTVKLLKTPMLTQAERNFVMSDEQNIKSTGNIIKSFADWLQQLYKNIADALEFSSKNAAQKELGRLAREGHGLYAYNIKGDVEGQMMYNLEKQGIAYAKLDGSNILIKETDLTRVRDLNREVLITKGNYYQEVSAEEYENAIARYDRLTDKDVLYIKNLDKYEYETLKNKCNDISRGFTIGTVANPDGKTYSLMIRSAEVFKNVPEGKRQPMDFCKAYLKANLSLYGPNIEVKKKEIDADDRLDKKIEELKDSDCVHYIVGADKSGLFIEMNSKEFQFYGTTVEDGKRLDNLITECDKDDPNYDYELQRCMDKLKSRAILDSSEELGKHLSTDKRNIDSERAERGVQEISNSMANDMIADKIDSMVRPLIRETDENRGEKQFLKYERMASEILKEAVTGRESGKYNHNDLEEIRNFAKDKGVDIDCYEEPAHRLMTKAIEERCAEKKRVKTVEKAVESHSIAKTGTKEKADDGDR